MTEERKIELGLKVKVIGKMLEEIAKEWSEENEISRVSIEVDGIYDSSADEPKDTTVHLFENGTKGTKRRMVAMKSYLDDKVDEVFLTDRNDIVGEENEDE